MTKPVIFFDGVCGLCNGFINFVIDVDRNETFMFSPLQSAYAKEKLPPYLTNDLKSVVLQIDGRTYTKSLAVLLVLKELGGLWRLASILRFVPASLSDKIYDFIAVNRYRFFEKKSTCRLPTPNERARFVL